MRLIDADEIKLPRGFFEKVDNVPKFYEWLGTLPTVDAVDVVRCKDCFYCRKYNEIWQLPKRDVLLCIRLYGGDGEEVSAEDYCSWGERRGDGDVI